MTDASTLFRLDEQIVLITGGGTGLGLACGELMVSAGARVALVGRRERELHDAAERIGNGAIALPADVTRAEDRSSILQRCCDTFGKPGVLVHAAGIHLKRPAVDTSPELMNGVLQTHLCAAFELSRLWMDTRDDGVKGSIVFVGSMAAILGIPLVAAYTAAKGAVSSLTRALATEWAPRNVRVNCVTPGWIETPMLRAAMDNDPQRKSRVLTRTPLARFGEPQDIAAAVLYLTSPAAAFVTGANLVIDGGASVGF